jgi:hypothetical protein
MKTLIFFVLAEQGCQMVYFNAKIPISVYFWVPPWKWKGWYSLRSFGISYGTLVYYTTIWYILWSIGIFFIVLVLFTKKTLAFLLLQCCRNPEHEEGLFRGLERSKATLSREKWMAWTKVPETKKMKSQAEDVTLTTNLSLKTPSSLHPKSWSNKIVANRTSDV